MRGELGPSLPTVGEGFVPHLGPRGQVVSQSFDLFGQTVGTVYSFDGLPDAGVQRPPPLLEEAAVRPLRE